MKLESKGSENSTIVLTYHSCVKIPMIRTVNAMESSIFFPYFYLPNEVLIRHQYLYTDHLYRIHASDRKPLKDSKQVKHLVQELKFPEDIIPNESIETVTQRYINALEEAYEHENPQYIRYLGKYGKERSSSKTFHLCRIETWPDIVKRVNELGMAKNENAGIWCFATRTMVILLTTSLALEYQKQRNIPRCTDDPHLDELAEVLECQPISNQDNTKIKRSILTFPYVVPDAILDLDPIQLKDLRQAILPTASSFQSSIRSICKNLDQSTSEDDINRQIEESSRTLTELMDEVSNKIKSVQCKPMVMNAQYRWYPIPNSQLANISSDTVFKHKQTTITVKTLEASAHSLESIQTYPGCFIWAQEIPKSSGISGMFKKIFRRMIRDMGMKKNK